MPDKKFDILEHHALEESQHSGYIDDWGDPPVDNEPPKPVKPPTSPAQQA